MGLETIYETQIRLGRITKTEAQNRIINRIKISNTLLTSSINSNDITGIVLHSSDISKAKNDLVSLHHFISKQIIQKF